MSHQRFARFERLLAPPVALALACLAWLFRLWYDTSSSREETFWAWLFWPSVAASMLAAARALLVWLPSHLRRTVIEYPWQFEITRALSALLAFMSILVLGRIAIFIGSDNWYFDAAWSYLPSPALVVTGLPVLVLIGAAGLWPRSRAQAPRDLLTFAFAVVALYLLVVVWSFLSRIACETCSGHSQ